MTLCLTHKRRSAYIPLGLRLKAANWDAKGQKVVGLPDRVALTNELLSQKMNMESIAMRMTREGKFVGKTILQIKKLLLDELDPEEKEVLFLEHYRKVLEKHENRRTREIYQATLNAILRFDPKAERKGFRDITLQWLDAFYASMATTSPSVNARNIHIRNIRAVFNDAITYELTDFYPFRKMKLRYVPTMKRSLSVDDLRAVFSAEVSRPRQKYIDIFKLIFCLIGVNTIDLLTAPPGAVYNGRFQYERAKTHRQYDIKVEPEAQRIIDTYAGTRTLLSVTDRCKTYRSFANRMNSNLKDIRAGVTTYYARHSWATIAAELDIPKETIAAALGHGGNSVTDIYIAFDRKKVDEANRKVLDWVLYGKK